MSFKKRIEFWSSLNDDGFLDKSLNWLYLAIGIVVILNIYFFITMDFNPK